MEAFEGSEAAGDWQKLAADFHSSIQTTHVEKPTCCLKKRPKQISKQVGYKFERDHIHHTSRRENPHTMSKKNRAL